MFAKHSKDRYHWYLPCANFRHHGQAIMADEWKENVRKMASAAPYMT